MRRIYEQAEEAIETEAYLNEEPEGCTCDLQRGVDLCDYCYAEREYRRDYYLECRAEAAREEE